MNGRQRRTGSTDSRIISRTSCSTMTSGGSKLHRGGLRPRADLGQRRRQDRDQRADSLCARRQSADGAGTGLPGSIIAAASRSASCRPAARASRSPSGSCAGSPSGICGRSIPAAISSMRIRNSCSPRRSRPTSTNMGRLSQRGARGGPAGENLAGYLRLQARARASARAAVGSARSILRSPAIRAEPLLSFRRPAWHAAVARECAAVAERVAVLDLPGFSKFEVDGRDAREWLDHLVAGVVPKPGRTALNYLCAPSGGIVTEMTLTNLGRSATGSSARPPASCTTSIGCSSICRARRARCGSRTCRRATAP
jgi:hypothetical protein